MKIRPEKLGWGTRHECEVGSLHLVFSLEFSRMYAKFLNFRGAELAPLFLKRGRFISCYETFFFPPLKNVYDLMTSDVHLHIEMAKREIIFVYSNFMCLLILASHV